MDVARVDPSGVDESAIGFRLGPRLNAAGRLYRADAGLELLLTADPERARAIAVELDTINSERRDVETRIRFEAEALLAEQSAPGAPAHVLAGEGWHPGVIGIVAARIAERHYRPTVLIALEGDEGSGSGRSIPGFDLLAGLEAGADELLRHGGHRAAAGPDDRAQPRRALPRGVRRPRRPHAHPGRPHRHRARRRGRARRHAAARAGRGARAAQALRLRQPCRLPARPGRAARRPAADGGGAPRRVLARRRRRPLALRAVRQGQLAPGRARRAGRRRRAAGGQPLQRHHRAPPHPALRPARRAPADRGDRRAGRGSTASTPSSTAT